jgi:ssDNA-binding Zn-finger/Zn-ribbon topoisomerase 1
MEQDIPDCPECGSPMRIRTNRATQDEFWGCSMYPQCRGTIAINKPDPRQQSLLEDPSPSERQRSNDRRRWES